MLNARNSSVHLHSMADSLLQLLRSVCADMRRSSDTDTAEWCEAWQALQCLCPDTLQNAAEILDHKTITRVVARESGREFFAVEANGRNTHPHTCLPGFCTCMSYCQNVASKPDQLVCKHELAVMLAQALGKTLTQTLDDAEWASKLQLATSIPMLAFDKSNGAL